MASSDKIQILKSHIFHFLICSAQEGIDKRYINAYFSGMYFRSSIRRNPETGELSGYYRLVESYRDRNGRVCHRTMLSAGFLDELTSDQLRQIQKELSLRIEGQRNELFQQETDSVVATFVERFYQQMVKKKRIDTTKKEKGKDWQTIDINTLRNKDVREIGAEWLCFQAINQLGIEQLLEGEGWAPNQVSLALTHLISRCVYPSSENKTSQWIRENSAVCEVTGYDMQKVTKDRLYTISCALYEKKERLEQHLSHRTNELFDLQDRIFLYDLTNTYYEGEKRHSQMARFGRSKEKRSDARLVVLALVINPEGFIKYSTIYEGNKTDCKTLCDMIDKLRLSTSSTGRRALVVFDAGIATEENLKMVGEKGYDYLCVTRSTLKNYTTETSDNCVIIKDKKNQRIELRRVSTPNSTDYYLKINSESKRIKESAMNSQFRDRFEAGLEIIENSLHKKSGTKKLDKVHQRIGRLKEKYPSIHRFYQIDTEADHEDVVTSLKWSQKQSIQPDQESGIYFLRTSFKAMDEEVVWTTYNTIREIESTFRVLKSDLDLRPVFHQNDEASMAHLHLGLLAYWVVNTIRYQLKQKGIKNNWQDIVRIMNTHKCVTTVAQNNKDEIISIRKCSEPTDGARQIYDTLKYKYAPFVKKKSVVLKTELKNPNMTINKAVMRY